LDWYERAIAALHDFAEAIEIASTFQQEPGTSREDLSNFWTNVQSAHLEIDRVSQEAPLYGSSAAVEQISKISKSVQKVADLSEAFDLTRIQRKKKDEILLRIYALPEELVHARRPLIAEARRHLGLDESTGLLRWMVTRA
jgi:hypothetical protein